MSSRTKKPHSLTKKLLAINHLSNYPAFELIFFLLCYFGWRGGFVSARDFVTFPSRLKQTKTLPSPPRPPYSPRAASKAPMPLTDWENREQRPGGITQPRVADQDGRYQTPGKIVVIIRNRLPGPPRAHERSSTPHNSRHQYEGLAGMRNAKRNKTIKASDDAFKDPGVDPPHSAHCEIFARATVPIA